MDLAAAELLGRDHLTGGGLHQRRAAEEDGALVADDDGLVAHRRHVRPAGGAGAEDGGDLRDAGPGHAGLVVEDPAEVLPVGEDLVLHGQEGAAGVDQVEAGETVLQGHFLGAQVLLHGHRVVGAALDGGVVRDDHALAPADPADARDHPGGRGGAPVHALGGQRGQLQEGRTGVEEGVHAVAGEQFPARGVAGAGLLAAAEAGRVEPGAQASGEFAVGGLIGPPGLGRRVRGARQHWCLLHRSSSLARARFVNDR